MRPRPARPCWILWLAVVALNPAVSHYEADAQALVWWLAGLFAVQALVAFGLWWYVLRRRRAVTA